MITFPFIEVCLPGVLTPLADLPEAGELSQTDLALYEKLGIESVLDSELSGAELAAKAASQVLSQANLKASDVDAFVLIQGRVPELLMTSEATRVQAEIGAQGATTFAVADLGCVSVNAALITARALLESNPGLKNVLVAHGSKPPTPRRFRRPVTVNGDGGIAALCVRDGGGPALIECLLETNGDYWDLFHVEYKDKPVSDWIESCKSPKTYSFRLAIESRNRFREINERILSKAGLKADQVDHYIMQNLSTGAFTFYEEFFKIRFAKACYENLARFGHLGSMDILFNLKTGIDSGELASGDRVLLMNNSPVAAWSSTLIEVP